MSEQKNIFRNVKNDTQADFASQISEAYSKFDYSSARTETLGKTAEFQPYSFAGEVTDYAEKDSAPEPEGYPDHRVKDMSSAPDNATCFDILVEKPDQQLTVFYNANWSTAYPLSVDWGDGNALLHQSALNNQTPLLHDYSSPGYYTVTLSGHASAGTPSKFGFCQVSADTATALTDKQNPLPIAIRKLDNRFSYTQQFAFFNCPNLSSFQVINHPAFVSFNISSFNEVNAITGLSVCNCRSYYGNDSYNSSPFLPLRKWRRMQSGSLSGNTSGSFTTVNIGHTWIEEICDYAMIGNPYLANVALFSNYRPTGPMLAKIGKAVLSGSNVSQLYLNYQNTTGMTGICTLSCTQIVSAFSETSAEYENGQVVAWPRCVDRTGLAFAGWKSTTTGQVYPPNSSYAAKYDETFTAKYTILPDTNIQAMGYTGEYISFDHGTADSHGSMSKGRLTANVDSNYTDVDHFIYTKTSKTSNPQVSFSLKLHKAGTISFQIILQAQYGGSTGLITCGKNSFTINHSYQVNAGSWQTYSIVADKNSEIVISFPTNIGWSSYYYTYIAIRNLTFTPDEPDKDPIYPGEEPEETQDCVIKFKADDDWMYEYIQCEVDKDALSGCTKLTNTQLFYLRGCRLFKDIGFLPETVPTYNTSPDLSGCAASLIKVPRCTGIIQANVQYAYTQNLTNAFTYADMQRLDFSEPSVLSSIPVTLNPTNMLENAKGLTSLVYPDYVSKFSAQNVVPFVNNQYISCIVYPDSICQMVTNAAAVNTSTSNNIQRLRLPFIGQQRDGAYSSAQTGHGVFLTTTNSAAHTDKQYVVAVSALNKAFNTVSCVVPSTLESLSVGYFTTMPYNAFQGLTSLNEVVFEHAWCISEFQVPLESGGCKAFQNVGSPDRRLSLVLKDLRGNTEISSQLMSHAGTDYIDVYCE